MFDATSLLYFYTETPLHAGSGTSVAWVDLPIQREAHTEYPMVQASGIKGALRDWASRRDPSNVVAVFGPETDQADKHAGCLAVTDARILLFPVRAFAEAFAWVTCPNVLARFRRDAGLAGVEGLPPVPAVGRFEARIPKGSGLAHNGAVLLEDMVFSPIEDEALAGWVEVLARALPDEGFGADALARRLAVVSDGEFAGFVRFSTEVINRIRIDTETGTVAKGALWAEEHLPSETVLYALAMAGKPRTQSEALRTGKDVLDWLHTRVLDQGGVLQLGGDETVGRGLVWVRSAGGEG